MRRPLWLLPPEPKIDRFFNRDKEAMQRPLWLLPPETKIDRFFNRDNETMRRPLWLLPPEPKMMTMIMVTMSPKLRTAH